jgi:hypothetical protein
MMHWTLVPRIRQLRVADCGQPKTPAQQRRRLFSRNCRRLRSRVCAQAMLSSVLFRFIASSVEMDELSAIVVATNEASRSHPLEFGFASAVRPKSGRQINIATLWYLVGGLSCIQISRRRRRAALARQPVRSERAWQAALAQLQ